MPAWRAFIRVAFVRSAVGVAGRAPGNAPLAGAVAIRNGDQQRGVTADRLNLGSGAGPAYRVVAVLERGEIVSIGGGTKWADGYEWVQQITVWVISRFLGTGGSDAPRDRVRVASGPLRVRSRPPLSGQACYSAPVGACGTVMDPEVVEAEGYPLVCVQRDGDGVIGWMALGFLSSIDVARPGVVLAMHCRPVDP